jgi:twinkle protein
MPPLFSTGWASMDPLLQLYRGTLMIVTGVPQHGKSLFALMLCANLSRSYGWKHCVALYEARVKPFVRGQLRQFYLCTSDIRSAEFRRVKEADDWIAEHFMFVHHDPRVDDEIIDVDWQLERFNDALARYDIDHCLVDPWNELEHNYGTGVSETDYTGNALRKFKRFARSTDTMATIVAHPTKMRKEKNGKWPVPTAYDISGSAHWFNKPDFNLAVYRDQGKPHLTQVHVQKVKERFAGKWGTATLQWNDFLSRFEDLEIDILTSGQRREVPETKGAQ